MQVRKGTTERARTVGRALAVDTSWKAAPGATAIACGSSRALVEAATEATLWVETFEREPTESLSVQADVAAWMAQSLALELGHARPACRGARHPDSVPESPSEGDTSAWRPASGTR
ncbi:MAG: hypothetical protein R2745_14705 [Vicinamibacterales bacterium]